MNVFKSLLNFRIHVALVDSCSSVILDKFFILIVLKGLLHNTHYSVNYLLLDVFS